MIRIGWKGKTYRLYSGKWGRPFQYDDALTVLIAINADIKDEKFKPTDWTKKSIEKRKFTAVYDQWLKEKEQLIREGEFAPATLKAYECYRRAHMQKLEDRNMAEIDAGDITEFKRELPAALSRKYKRNIINALRALFSWAKEERIIDSVPDFPKWRKEKKIKQRAATYDDQMKYINKLPEEHQDIHKIMQKFALRAGEACVIQCRDFQPNPQLGKEGY